MRRRHKLLVLSSTLVLSAFLAQHQVEATQVIAQKINLKAIESTATDGQRTTADIFAEVKQEKTTLTLSNLSAQKVVEVKITVFSKLDKSDSHTYTAILEKDGTYKVVLDTTKHAPNATQFTSKVSIVREGAVTDFLSDYQFSILPTSTTVPVETPSSAIAETEKTVETAPVPDKQTATSPVEFSPVKVTEDTKPSQPASDVPETETVASTISSESVSFEEVLGQDNFSLKPEASTKDDTIVSEKADAVASTKTETASETATSTQDETNHFGTEPIQRNATSGELKTVGTLTVTNKNEQAGSFDIIISNVETPEGVEEVQVPVWSATGGQDDIRWYIAKKQLDNTYKVSVSISNHNNDLGEYYIHLYYLDRKKRQLGVGATSTKIARNASEATGKININRTNALTGEFEVVVSDIYAPNGLKEVIVPIWSDEGGQDDIQWYTAAKQNDGTFRVNVSPANHKNNLGLYHVHLYYLQNDGQMTGITATTTVAEKSAVSGRLTVTNKNDAAGTFDIVVSDVASTTAIQDVIIPVWSDKDGQDDIQWYTATKQADGTYKVSVKASDHKHQAGTYHIHLYYRQVGGQINGVAAIQDNIKAGQSSGVLNIANKNDKNGTFDVIVSAVNPGYEVKEVFIPVWSENGGQDDIQWYKASKQADGTYKISVSISNHQSNTGDYHVHAYHQTPDGLMKGIGTIQIAVQATEAQATGNVNITKHGDGSFDVLISNVYAPEGIDRILVPVWADANGQDDIQWYTAQIQGDGTYKVTVNPASHGNISGTYHVHAYYGLKNGQTKGISALKVDVEAKAGASGLTVNYLGTGNHAVTISGVQGVGNMSVAVWSDANGQDDIVWYAAQQTAPGTYSFNFNAQNHSATGTYHIHAYLFNGAQQTGVAVGTTNVARTEYSAPYYSQSDSRWGHLIYGAYNMSYSGCVPTVVAMAISGIKGQTVTPTEVASYLYNNTQEFNRIHGAGTTAVGVIRGANNWGVNGTPLHGKEALINSLQNGYYVAAAVGNSVFVKSPATHELLLKGYQNGKTYVMDPYTPAMNGWYDVDYILSIPSNWHGDVYQGTTLIQLSD